MSKWLKIFLNLCFFVNLQAPAGLLFFSTTKEHVIFSPRSTIDPLSRRLRSESLSIAECYKINLSDFNQGHVAWLEMAFDYRRQAQAMSDTGEHGLAADLYGLELFFLKRVYGLPYCYPPPCFPFCVAWKSIACEFGEYAFELAFIRKELRKASKYFIWASDYFNKVNDLERESISLSLALFCCHREQLWQDVSKISKRLDLSSRNGYKKIVKAEIFCSEFSEKFVDLAAMGAVESSGNVLDELFMARQFFLQFVGRLKLDEQDKVLREISFFEEKAKKTKTFKQAKIYGRVGLLAQLAIEFFKGDYEKRTLLEKSCYFCKKAHVFFSSFHDKESLDYLENRIVWKDSLALLNKFI